MPRFADTAFDSLSNEYGNYIFKRGMGEVRKPTWQKTTTVVRILPQYDFKSNTWSPFRYSPAPLDFGDWLRRYVSVRGFGTNGITLLLYDPEAHANYDINTNPCVVLFKAINSAIDMRVCDPEWPSLLKGAAGRRAVLSRHQPVYLARCGIFCIKSKDMATNDHSPLGLDNRDPPFFIELPKTAGEKILSLLEEKTEDYQGEPDDYDAAYKFGDIVSLDKGAFVHIYEEGTDTRTSAEQTTSAPRQLSVSTGGRGNYGGGGGDKFKGYDAHITKTYNGYSANLNSPELERLIKSKQRPWEECLNFMSHTEQAHLIQTGFPASAILYAFKDHPDWILDTTRSAAVGRTSVSTDTRVSYPQDRGFAQTPQPAIRSSAEGVGGWGARSSFDTEPKDGVKDAVVPGSIPDGGSATAVADPPEVESKAMAALAAARARAANRSA